MPSTVPAVGGGGFQQVSVIVTVFIAVHGSEAPSRESNSTFQAVRV